MKLSQRGADEMGVTDAVDISALVGNHTTQNQYDAMVSLATEIGIVEFAKSSLLRKHNAKCYLCAQAQFSAWAARVGNQAKRNIERGIYYYGYQ